MSSVWKMAGVIEANLKYVGFHECIVDGWIDGGTA